MRTIALRFQYTVVMVHGWILHFFMRLHPQPVRVPVVAQSEMNDQGGQITVEYFLIAALIASLTLIGISIFPTLVKNTLEGFVDVAAKRFAGS